MRVLLIQPPVEDFYQTAIRTQPLGLASLAASLRMHGHEPVLLDCQEPGKKHRLPLPEEYAYMQRFYARGDISPFRLYGGFSHFGLPWETVRERIAEARADAVGISCQFTPYAEETERTAGLVKSVGAGIPVIVGGAHATALPEEVLKSKNIDYVVLGEGELTFSELINRLAERACHRNLPGIAYRDSGSVIINSRPEFIENLDSLPPPARDLLNPRWYGVGADACAMLLTSRGCPRNCAYCSVHQVMGRRMRYRSPGHVVAEMKRCHELYGITAFDFEDDNFTFDRGRALEILDGIVRAFGERRLRLFAMNGLSLISLDEELLHAMRAAGFERLDLSLGSSSPELNCAMDRPADRDRADRALEAAARLGLPATVYIILGMPAHGIADMAESMAYLMERPCMLGPSIFYPSPGTRTFEEVRAAGLCDLSRYAGLRSSLFPVETPQCSRLDLVTLLRLCRWINFTKGLLARKGEPACDVAGLPLLLAGALRADAGCGQALQAEAAGISLSSLLLEEHIFYGMRRIRPAQEKMVRYETFPYETSRKSVEIFFEKAHSRKIRAQSV